MTVNFAEERIYLKHIRDFYCGGPDRTWNQQTWTDKIFNAAWGTFFLALILGMYLSLFVALPVMALGAAAFVWEAVAK